MKTSRHLTFWLLTALVLAGLLWLLSAVLLPFVAGIALAYLQVPFADWLERHGMNRTLATLLIVIAVMLVLFAAVLLLVPLLVQQLNLLATGLPNQVSRMR